MARIGTATGTITAGSPATSCRIMLRDPNAGTIRDIRFTVPIAVSQYASFAIEEGLPMMRIHTSVAGNVPLAIEILEHLRRSLGGSAFMHAGDLFQHAARNHAIVADFLERRERDPGHARLLLEEAKELAYTSPLPFLDALAIIDRRESDLASERAHARILAIVGGFGESIRGIGEAMGASVAEMLAAGMKMQELGEDADWADERRSARLGAIAPHRRPASDPEYHRWAAWRHRNGVDHGRRLPMIRARGMGKRR